MYASVMAYPHRRASYVRKQVHIAIDPTINSSTKCEFIKFTVQTLNAQLSERFTDHQRVVMGVNI